MPLMLNVVVRDGGPRTPPDGGLASVGDGGSTPPDGGLACDGDGGGAASIAGVVLTSSCLATDLEAVLWAADLEAVLSTAGLGIGAWSANS